MSQHSYTRCWLHLIWGTRNREPLLPREARKRVSGFLMKYAQDKEIFMKLNYVNADHTHALIDLPTRYSIEEILQLLKGSSSHWINQNDLISGKFAWGRGYAAFSVSHSNVDRVVAYIANQEEHHRVKTFAEEYENFIRKHGLVLLKED